LFSLICRANILNEIRNYSKHGDKFITLTNFIKKQPNEYHFCFTFDIKSSIMKIVKFIFALLFGLMFINAGLNKFFNYMPMEKPTPEQMKLFAAFGEIHWLMPLVIIHFSKNKSIRSHCYFTRNGGNCGSRVHNRQIHHGNVHGRSPVPD
jgi:hypothetical protein